MSETDGSPTGTAAAYLELGRTMAEQYLRDGGASHQLTSLARPAICKQAMQAAADEQDYYAKCHALGLPSDDAKQILTDTVTFAEQRGLPMTAVWERAWPQAIEKSMT